MYCEDDLLHCGEIESGQCWGGDSRCDPVEGEMGEEKRADYRFGLELESTEL